MSALTQPDNQQHNEHGYTSLEPLVDLCAPAMNRVNKVIVERLASDVPLIPELASHLIAAGGKRMRPMLTVAAALTANAQAEVPKEAHYLAAAVEFIHSATLLHDDVIDKSEKRRGRETTNALWGNQASVLVGDFLFARAFELMVETGDLLVLGMLSSASARITEGEVKQMTMTGVPDSSMEDYLSVIKNKTAVLFAAAAEAGARVGGGNDGLCKALHDYGLHLGMAFQICDDALDYEANPVDIGKNAGDDFHEGKITLPVIFAWQDADKAERTFWQHTIGEGMIEDGDLDKAQSILARHDAVSRALVFARNESEAAIVALGALSNGPVKSALCEAALFAGKRSY